MKRTQILKQEYELSNDFNKDAFILSLQSQLDSLIFKELINGEKHSLTIEVKVSVNEEETEDKDPKLVEAMKIIKQAKQLYRDLPREVTCTNPGLFELLTDSLKVDTKDF